MPDVGSADMTSATAKFGNYISSAKSCISVKKNPTLASLGRLAEGWTWTCTGVYYTNLRSSYFAGSPLPEMITV